MMESGAFRTWRLGDMAPQVAGHIVLRHPDAEQKWPNVWRNRIGPEVDAITTDAEVASHCMKARRKGLRVRFHRCAHSSFPSVICCEASVKDVQKMGKDYLVYFEKQVALSLVPTHTPHPKQYWY